MACLAAERRHVHRGPVRPIDNSAVHSLPSASPDDPAASFIVSDSLVPLQVAVVKESLATEVAHERL